MTKRRWWVSLGAGGALAALVGWGLSALDLVTAPEPPRTVHVIVWTVDGTTDAVCVGGE